MVTHSFDTPADCQAFRSLLLPPPTVVGGRPVENTLPPPAKLPLTQQELWERSRWYAAEAERIRLARYQIAAGELARMMNGPMPGLILYTECG